MCVTDIIFRSSIFSPCHRRKSSPNRLSFWMDEKWMPTTHTEIFGVQSYIQALYDCLHLIVFIAAIFHNSTLPLCSVCSDINGLFILFTTNLSIRIWFDLVWFDKRQHTAKDWKQYNRKHTHTHTQFVELFRNPIRGIFQVHDSKD